MRKFVLLASAFTMATIMPAAPAFAEGGIVLNGDDCAGFVPTATGQFDPTTIMHTTDSHQVQNGGWVTVTCHFDIPDEWLPAKGVQANNVPCMIPGFGAATSSRMAASPGGRAVGTCRKKLR
jgi:hypothetical protein